MKTLALAVTAATLLATSGAYAADNARYQVEFNATWTAQSHPLDYPGNAHFSGLVGATHNADYTLFADAGTATPGLEALSEMGAHKPLTDEIGSAIARGSAGELFESRPLFQFPGTLSASFAADPAHPFVSVAAMVAPSPDWFTGVRNLELYKDGNWIDRVTVTLFVWDAGTDDGTTYQAPDADTQPRKSVRLNASPHFLGDGGLIPVGTATFTRIKGAVTN